MTDLKNLFKRTVTGTFLVVVILVLINSGAYGFILLVMAINVLGLLEFYRLVTAAKFSLTELTGLALAASLVITLMLVLNRECSWEILMLNVPFAFLVFFCELYLKREKPFDKIALTFMGIICITVPLCFFIAAAYLPVNAATYHSKLALAYFFILWANDTGAFLVGKNIGKHRLFVRISPNKTWEGSFGGAAAAALVAIVISHYFTGLGVIQWFSMALIIVITGTFGDFFKSLLKRSLNIKDTGTILPGHGGILDRFDSLLGSAPFVFSYLVLYGNIKA